MVEFTGFCSELMGNMLYLIIVPFKFPVLAIQHGARAVSTSTLLCISVVKAITDFHVNIFWSIMVWISGCISFPVRILIALQREEMLEFQLQDMQSQLGNLLWENKGLEARLLNEIKERKVIETVLEDVEEEHEKALERIEILESELQCLKEEHHRLKELQGKAITDHKVNDEKDVVVHNSKSLTSSICGTLEGIPVHGTPWSKIGNDSGKHKDIVEVASHCPFSPEVMENRILDELLEKEKVVALYRSLFSSLFSLLVGMIIWKAEDSCLPLLVALFAVVGMSLSSVVQFFSSIKNKPASDAVALLSINWFILGTLTTPTLPSIAHVLWPNAVQLSYRFSSWLGFSAL